jgi:hypothetical protein
MDQVVASFASVRSKKKLRALPLRAALDRYKEVGDSSHHLLSDIKNKSKSGSFPVMVQSGLVRRGAPLSQLPHDLPCQQPQELPESFLNPVLILGRCQRLNVFVRHVDSLFFDERPRMKKAPHERLVQGRQIRRKGQISPAPSSGSK